MTHGRFISEDPIRSSSNPYTYCGHDPVNMVDRDGLFVETAFDIGCILWDIGELIKHPTWGNLGWLLVDIGCAFVPFLPAVGGIVRAGKMADRALDAGRAIDRGSDASEVLTKAARLRENQRIGLVFQNEVISKLGLFRGGRLNKVGGMTTYRVADALTAGGDIVEVKHVSKLRVTDQTRDMLRCCEKDQCQLMFVLKKGKTPEAEWGSLIRKLGDEGFDTNRMQVWWFP